jgi:hypothetical protein
MARSESAAMERIHGQWRLLSYQEQGPDGNWFDALGPGSHGVISYWPHGRMQVLIGSAQRPRLRGDWAAVPAADKAACLDGLVAYAGRYSIADDLVTHHVDLCWITNWEGRALVRRMSFPTDHQLLLQTVPDPPGRGRAAQSVLWERAG